MRKEEFYDLIKQVYYKHGYINRSILENEIKGFNVGWQLSKYNGLKNICKEIGIEYTQKSKIKDKDIKKNIVEIYNKYGYMSTELYEKYGKYSISAIKSHFGGINNLMKSLNIPITMSRMDSQEDIIQDFNRFYSRYNTISSTAYRKHGHYSQSVINRLFGSWATFIEILGFTPKGKKIGKDKIISDVLDIYNEYGFISKDLINNNCDFTYQALRYYYSKEELSTILGVENPFLKRDSSGAKQLYKILCSMFGKDNITKEYHEPWLRNPKTNRIMYVDFLIKNVNIAIEYDGKQHYEYIEFIHKKFKNFYNQVYRDRIKEKILDKHDIKVIRFRYDEKINEDTISKKLSSM